MSNINEERFSAKAVALYCHITPATVYNRAARLNIRKDRTGYTSEQARMINEYLRGRRFGKLTEDDIRRQYQRLTELLK